MLLDHPRQHAELQVNGSHASSVAFCFFLHHFRNAHRDGKLMHGVLVDLLCILVKTSKRSRRRLTQADAPIIGRDGAVGPDP